MARILIGTYEPQYVHLTDGEGNLLIDGEFLVPPVTAEVRRRWQEKYGFCKKCGGVGVLSFGEHAPRCPICHANPQAASLDKPEIQAELVEELCLEWRNVPVKGGGLYEFSPANRASLISAYPEVFWALLREGDLIAKGQAEAQGKA